MPYARKDQIAWLPGHYYHLYNRGARQGALVDRAFVQMHFPSPKRYEKFVIDYLKTRYLPEDVKNYLESLESKPK